VKRAYCDIREKPEYRAEAFISGLKANGFHVLHRQLPAEPPKPGDVLVIWNRYSVQEQTADTWEKQGGTVLVAENGYCGRDANGHQLYALAVHGHNGSGTWRAGGPERWERLGLELKPWRARGEHVLVCPNRHFGMKDLAMPVGWEQETVKRLRQHTKRPVRVRPHPQNSAPAVPLAAELERCHAVVVWASSAGVHALLAGVPVIALSKWWICKAAASPDVSTVEAPPPPERRPVFERLAWAQWTVEEIARGEPFAHLLSAARQSEIAAAV
jgi:hypothetical protein